MTAASTTWLAHPLIAAILARAETLPPSVETLRSLMDDQAEHIGRQRERIKALEAALRPFADRTCGFLGSVTDSHVVTARELLGLPAYRRSEQEEAARAVLSGEAK